MIHVYKDNPSAGCTDGAQVSKGTGFTPVDSGKLNATENEKSAAIKLVLRCEAGYQTSGDITITPTGTTAVKWALAPDNAGAPGVRGAYGSALTIVSVIGATNTIFWVKAKATSDETLVNDISVHFQVDAVIAAA